MAFESFVKPLCRVYFTAEWTYLSGWFWRNAL